jgi:hypothetical protein
MIAMLVANLGNSRVAIKGVEYSLTGDPTLGTGGSPGWYEVPEAAYGRGRRLLPTVLEPGETVDLPLFSYEFFDRAEDMKMWLNTFDDKRIYLDEVEIKGIAHTIARANKSE